LGIATKTCTNPLWVIKTWLQLDKDWFGLQLNGITRMYKNSWDCVAKIIYSEGLRGLYRGLALSYLGVTEFALQWVLYEHIKATLGIGRERKELIGRGYAKHNVSFNWVGELGAGGALKLIAAAIAYPHEAGLLYLNRQVSLLIH
jgi:solute carrier family 25 protein 33/36